jgi:translation initiation factor eIF-2B subunit beta
MRMIVVNGTYDSVEQLMDIIRSVGRTLTQAHPIELTIGNIVRRVLMIVRREALTLSTTKPTDTSENTTDTLDAPPSLTMFRQLSTIFTHSEETDETQASTSNPTLSVLRPNVEEEIGMLMDELKNSSESIAESASDHIHAREVVLTHGYSPTATAFFQEASKFRSFSVVVVESAPSFAGHRQAVELAKMGIEATVITDSAVFAMMPHVSKVIIGTHGIMPNGGVLALSGAMSIAVAAKFYHKPLVVLSGIHKLCPLYAYDQDTFNEHNPPSQVISFENEFVESVDVQNPALDYLVPELVTLFITNVGSHPPSYLYRLLAEYYHHDDYDL